MIKNVIAPIQAFLLSKGHCVGCNAKLSKGKENDVRGLTTVTCKCGRIFIKTKKDNRTLYRRALFSEI